MLSKKHMIIAFIAVWIGFEFLFLNGETVIDRDHQIGVPIAFAVTESGDDYRVTIGREKGGTGGVARALNYKLVAPDGKIVHSDEEVVPRRRRSFDFRSIQSGEYILYIQGSSQTYAGNKTTWIQVDKNDHTLLLRLLGL